MMLTSRENDVNNHAREVKSGWSGHATVLSIAQSPTTFGVGFLLDNLVVRNFVLPSLIAH